MLATSTVRSQHKPGWQTDELEDEWIESSPSHNHDDDNNDNIAPVNSLSIASNGRFDDVVSNDFFFSPEIPPTSTTPPGTFLIREDQLAAPILPKPLLKGRNQALLKDFFSPLALERMFEPPSPQQIDHNLATAPSLTLKDDHATYIDNEVLSQNAKLEIEGNPIDEGLGENDMEEETRPIPIVDLQNHGDRKEIEGRDVILASDIPNLMSFDGRKPSSSYKFTFSATHSRAPKPSAIPGRTSISSQLPVKNTPFSQAPPTDPRLRLFRFQYDTFTRDHLSAVVDSIAVHTPSSDSSKSHSPVNMLSHVNSRSSPPPIPEAPNVYLRATKRLKLTPPESLSHVGTLDSKMRKDYVGESKNLMRMIKQARSPSMMTVMSGKENIQPTNIEDPGTTEDQPRRAPLGNLHSMWFSDTQSEACSQHHADHSPVPSCPQPSTAHASTSLQLVYPTSTLTPSIPSSFSSIITSNSKPTSVTSALGYRRQAADLMAQIRKDMTTGKRLVSLETVKDKLVDEEDQKERNLSLQVCVTFAGPSNAKTAQQNSSRVQSSSPQFSATSSSPPPASNEKPKLHVTRKVPKPSPRKLLRRLSAADEVDRELAMNQSNFDTSFPVPPPIVGPQTKPLEQSFDSKDAPHTPSSQPPPHTETHLQTQSIQVLHMSTAASSPPKTMFLHPPTRVGPNRVTSGGTVSSLETADSVLTRGTSATSATSVITGRTASIQSVASAASFVKHAGPVQMTRIGPEDVPSLPEMVGGMRFDRQLMRWVKAGPARAAGKVQDLSLAGPSEETDDPFRSFESLESGRIEEPGNVSHPVELDGGQPVVENASEDQEFRTDKLAAAVTAMSLPDDDTDDSFDFDYNSGDGVVEVMTGIDSHDADTDTETTDSDNDGLQPAGDNAEITLEKDHVIEDNRVVPAREPMVTIPSHPITFPESYNTPSPAHRTGLVPPRSVLKNGNSSLKTPGSVARTPHNLFTSAHRRSVSFSDGRKDGKIKGLERAGVETNLPEPNPVFPVITSENTTPFVPSARGNRITAHLEDLADPSFEEQTPSKASTSSRPPSGTIQASVPKIRSNTTSRKPFSRSTKEKELSLAQGNQTFLTECSFGITQDKLVHIITDVHPYVPHWETLDHINLSKKSIESVARLKEFLPNLNSLNLEGNLLLWLTGVPKRIRTLSLASNLLTAMTSFNHLLNLESLDISNNQIDSLQQLSCLKHLRELRADGNEISSLDGLGELDGLTKLSLKENCITMVDLRELHWSRLELLNLSCNGLRRIAGLSSLSSLSALNLDHNHLVSLDADGPMSKLRTLRISNNRLTRLDVSRFMNVRTLYADNNKLCGVDGAQKLRILENLSLRNQGGEGLTLATNEIRDVKRLYLSGNPLSCPFLDEPCYNLLYLEVAACRLTQLPQDLTRLIPNVRVLNLNYNFLTDAQPLEGLTRLRKLTLIGSRLKGTKSLIRILRRMPDIEMLDFRMNPCTLGWYLPILVQDVPGALQPSEATRSEKEKREVGGNDRAATKVNGGGSAAPHSHGDSWQDLDAKFRRDLPDEAYVGRLAYRGLVMRACPKVRMLDGVVVEEREREKAERLLQGVLSAKAKVRT